MISRLPMPGVHRNTHLHAPVNIVQSLLSLFQ